MNDPATVPRTRRVLLPLRADNDRYRAFSGTVGPSADLRVQSALRNLLERSADRVPGEAEIDGRLYQTLLYVPRNDEGVVYVETDQDGVPVDAPTAAPILEMFPGYISGLRARCARSDYLTPDTQVSLSAQFILPAFTVLGQDGGQRLTWDELRHYARLVITGPPGAGKTSCLRRLVLDMTPGGSFTSDDTLPVFIQLRDVRVADFSSTTIRRMIGGSQADLLTEFSPPLNGGRLLLAIDGLDEIGTQEERDEFLDRLMALCRELPRVRVILTTRESVPADRLEGYARVRLEPFNQPQVQQWARQYLVGHNPGHSRWQEFLDLARFDEDFYQLVKNPLLLSLASSLHWKYPDELNNRAGLLRKCIDVLIQDWDAARGIARWRRSNVTPRQVRRLMNKLSARLVSEKRDNSFAMDDVEATIESVSGFGSSHALLAACRSNGLVAETRDGRFCFTHQWILDYCAANDMVTRTGSMADTIQGFSTDEDGTSFWRLACALTSDADGLLSSVREYGLDGTSVQQRAAAYMLAQALGEEVTASEDVIDGCCHYVAGALEARLDGVQALDEAAVPAAWPRQENRVVLWAGGAVTDRDDEDFRTTADLVKLIYRARTATTGSRMRERLRDSPVPLVRQIAGALAHDGWCHTDIAAPDGRQTRLYIVVTRSAAPEAEQPRPPRA